MPPCEQHIQDNIHERIGSLLVNAVLDETAKNMKKKLIMESNEMINLSIF